MADMVAMLTNEPKAVVYRCFQCFDIFFGRADFDKRVRAETEWVFVPPRHIARNGFNLFFEMELRCEVDEVLKDFLVRKFAHCYTGWSWYKQAKHGFFWSRYRHSSWISTWFFCHEVEPLFLLIPESFLESNKKLIGDSIPYLLDSFLVRLWELWLKLHQTFLKNSYRQTRNDLPSLEDFFCCVYLHNIIRVIHLCDNLIESHFWFVEIVDSFEELKIPAFR